MNDLTFIDKAGRKRKAVAITCPTCNEIFLTRKDQPGKYCNRQCASRGKQNRVQLTCDWCKKDFERSVSKAYRGKSDFNFCTRKCKDEAQKLGGITEIMPDHFGTRNIPEYRKFFTEEEMFCRRCGYYEFISSVDIHHIDGDRTNNQLSNLIPLCKCCHQGLHCGYWKFEELGL